jgi:hypothetical protein
MTFLLYILAETSSENNQTGFGLKVQAFFKGKTKSLI